MILLSQNKFAEIKIIMVEIRILCVLRFICAQLTESVNRCGVHHMKCTDI